jgi:hypothetical protein
MRKRSVPKRRGGRLRVRVIAAPDWEFYSQEDSFQGQSRPPERLELVTALSG